MNLEKRLLGIILVVAVLLRLAVAVYLGDSVRELPGIADQLSYHTLAQRVLGGHGFSFEGPWWPVTAPGAPTAHWSFLYTFYVAAVYALFGPHPLAARLIQVAIVGVLHPLLVYGIGRRLFGLVPALLAAGMAALYPYFIYYSAALMTEPFYFVMVLVTLYLAILLGGRLHTERTASETDVDASTAQLRPGSGSLRGAGATQPARAQPSAHSEAPAPLASILRISAALGLALAATVLLRQLFLLFIPFLLGWLWLANRRRIDRGLIAAAALILAIIAVSIVPFTLYNQSRFGQFVLLNTNAGYVIFWANHPIYGAHFIPILPPEMGTYLDLIPIKYRGLDEAALDRALLGEALQIIRADPGRYLLLSLSRIPAYFMFWPSADSDPISNLSRVGGFGLLLPFTLYGLVRAFSPGMNFKPLDLGSPVFLLLLFVVVYAAVHILSWALVRYRLPIDSIFMLFAGLALNDLYSRFPGLWRSGLKSV